MFIGFAIIWSLSIVWAAFTQTIKTVNELTDENLPFLLALAEIRTAGLRILASSNEFTMVASEISSLDPEADNKIEIIRMSLEKEVKLINHGSARYEMVLNEIQNHISEGHGHLKNTNKIELAHLMKAAEEFREKCFALVNAKKAGEKGMAILDIKEELELLEDNFIEAIEGFIKTETEIFLTHKNDLLLKISKTVQSLVFIGIVVIGVIFISWYLISRAVTKPINRLVSFVHEIGKGKLDSTIKIQTNDELGQLTKNVQKMVSNLSASMEKEKKAIETVTKTDMAVKHEKLKRMELQDILNQRDLEILQRKEAQNQLFLAGNVIENAIDGIALTDTEGKIVQVNPSFTAITGYSEKEALGKNPRILKSDRHGQDFYTHMWESIIHDGKWKGEIWNRRKNGETYPEWLTITAIKNNGNETTHYVAVFHDISEIKRSEEKLKYQAYHDPLTGLPNRELFNDRLKIAIEHTKRNHGQLVILYCDLDNFKNINDSFGHYTGDLFLKKVAQRLKDNCRAEDTVARLGGDEFVILLASENLPSDSIDTAKRVLRVLRNQAFLINDRELYASASIGITFFPEDGDDVETLVKNADIAMYQAKNAGKNMFKVFTKELDVKLQARMLMENALRKAIDQNEFIVFYQPKLNLKTGEITGCEALVRWENSSGEIISPLTFIPLAEETGLIVPIGEWVLKTACKKAKQWQDQGFSIKTAVNLSGIQFRDQSLLHLITSTLKETGLAPTLLELEITESMLMKDRKKITDVIDGIRQLGVTIAIDDFGTGYSSLAYLKSLPIDVLKIDRSFIKDIPEVREDITIVKAILSMSKALELDVVAEGVETIEHLSLLCEHQCEMMQGFLFSPPLPDKEFEKMLQEGKKLTIPPEVIV